MTLHTLAHRFVALNLNDLLWIVKLMIRLTWITQLTDTALLAGKETQLTSNVSIMWSKSSDPDKNLVMQLML